MATSNNDSISMAVFCDFENVALGVRDAQYEQFDIRPVLERLLVKGSIVVKKAYCDWDRYKGFKNAMHEANFELIEIPHVRHSGKNSADIRLVVDALDLCYTKSHVDTFVIISGDSDFSPLVSKLRENAKQVIGVGVKQSTSDLLIANCDEFIFYDDLVREQARRSGRQGSSRDGSAGKRNASPEDNRPRREDLDTRRAQALEITMETYDALSSERGDGSKLWASVLKDAIKRRRPDFNESYYGFRAFGNLLEEAQARGLLRVGRDERSGTYVWRDGNAALVESPASSDERGHEGSDPSEKGAEQPRRRDERRDKDKRQGERKKSKDDERHGDGSLRERQRDTRPRQAVQPATADAEADPLSATSTAALVAASSAPSTPAAEIATAAPAVARAQAATSDAPATASTEPLAAEALPADAAQANAKKPTRRTAATQRNSRNSNRKTAHADLASAAHPASGQPSGPETSAVAATPATATTDRPAQAETGRSAPKDTKSSKDSKSTRAPKSGKQPESTVSSAAAPATDATRPAATTRPSDAAATPSTATTTTTADPSAATSAAPAKKTSRRKPKTAHPEA